jgi:hypothetical protein
MNVHWALHDCTFMQCPPPPTPIPSQCTSFTYKDTEGTHCIGTEVQMLHGVQGCRMRTQEKREKRMVVQQVMAIAKYKYTAEENPGV